jgi:hypothetical protein
MASQSVLMEEYRRIPGKWGCQNGRELAVYKASNAFTFQILDFSDDGEALQSGERREWTEKENKELLLKRAGVTYQTRTLHRRRVSQEINMMSEYRCVNACSRMSP